MSTRNRVRNDRERELLSGIFCWFFIALAVIFCVGQLLRGCLQ